METIIHCDEAQNDPTISEEQEGDCWERGSEDDCNEYTDARTER